MPARFRDLQDHVPAVLWVRSARPIENIFERSVALVGARAASGYGEHVTAELAAGASREGITVVSGAAYGIDGMAHRAALATGGVTVAVLAGGVDRLYPQGHEQLLSRILAEGAIVSEVPCGVAPTKWRFLQRNRLIAAATRATVVVEAGRRSGSLNTAGHAATLGRALGAVPGPVTSPTSAGCHHIIREYGATCITSVEQMVELAGYLDHSVVPATRDARSQPSSWADYSHEELRVRDALSRRPRRTAAIAISSGLQLAEAEGALALLELRGHAEERAAGWVRLT